jgi:SAM-dependent methyltransferase
VPEIGQNRSPRGPGEADDARAVGRETTFTEADDRDGGPAAQFFDEVQHPPLVAALRRVGVARREKQDVHTACRLSIPGFCAAANRPPARCVVVEVTAPALLCFAAMTTVGEDPWEQHAGWWQEGFTEGADPEYEERILPLAAEWLRGAGRVLDVGTGEGQIARRAAQAGAGLVVGVDPTWGQLTVARERAGGPVYARGAAASLPCRTGSFDAVVACLVFEHIVEFAEAIAEVARVLRPGGRFLFFLNHPLLQTPNSGWIDDHILEEQYWRIGPYLVDDESEEEVAPGVCLPFIHRPLSRYVNAMADAGLLIERMEEPAPPEGFLERAEEYREAATIPRLLFLAARRVRPV